MGLWERIKEALSPEQRAIVVDHKNIEELSLALERMATENGVAARAVMRDIDRLEREEERLKTEALAPETSRRAKEYALREIRRVRRRIASADKKLKVFTGNIELHQGILDRVDELRAMDLKHVNQSQIEDVAIDYEDKRDAHRDVVQSAQAAQGYESGLDEEVDRKELDALERELRGETAPEPVKVEAPPVKLEKPKVEPTVSEIALDALVAEMEADKAAEEKVAKVETPQARRKSIEDEIKALDAEMDEDAEDDEALLEE